MSNAGPFSDGGDGGLKAEPVGQRPAGEHCAGSVAVDSGGDKGCGNSGVIDHGRHPGTADWRRKKGSRMTGIGDWGSRMARSVSPGLLHFSNAGAEQSRAPDQASFL